jgi:radical SAM protein with 4Fe4S-binding SPASM domain
MQEILSTLAKYLPERLRSPLALMWLTTKYGLSFRKGWRDLVLSSGSAILKTERAWGRPVYLTVEPTNICNLRCPVCETGAGILRREKGYMSSDNFKLIIDKLGVHTNTMLLYFMGETFLNKDAYAMIKYATEKKIFVNVCTNGDFVNPKAVIEAGTGEIEFQIGGMTQETHQIYRVNGNLKKTLDNLVATIAEKKKHPQSKTIISLGFIVMKHNEHEIDAFLKLAQDIGVDRTNIVAPCVRTIEQGQKFIPEDDKYWLYDRTAFEKGVLRPKIVPHNRCDWLYYSATIQYNGDVVPCCRDPHGDYVLGNILRQDFKEIWNGQKYRELRRKVKTNQQNLELCRLCSSYGIPGLL